MNNMKTKNLSLILATLLSAGLTACNSGGSNPASKNTQNAVAESAVEALTTPNNSYSAGVVLTSDGNLDYYKNDKFMGKLWHFEDTPVAVDMVASYSGDAIWVVYVGTVTGELKRCTIQENLSTECSTIGSQLVQFPGSMQSIKMDIKLQDRKSVV